MIATSNHRSTGPRSRWQSEHLWTVFVCIIFTLLSVAMQYWSGAFHADLCTDADEPVHAVSSLMVRDYLVQSFPANPLAFAREFYSHYPKVGIGHWPPLFYCAEALGMLIAGRSRIAMLLFVALCGGALLGSVFCALRRRTSISIALLSAVVLLCSPTFANMLCAVRPDLLLALVVFWAAIFCAGYMLRHSRSSGLYFVALFVIAGLVHGRGLVLLLLPFCLVPFRDRRPTWKWIIAGCILFLIITVPHVTGDRTRYSVAYFLLQGGLFFSRSIFSMGWIASLLAVVGSAAAFTPGPHRRFWQTMVALTVACFLFVLLVPVQFSDYLLITLLPALTALAGSGIEIIASALTKVWKSSRLPLEIVFVVIAITVAGWGTQHVAPKLDLGYHQLIADCLLCNDKVSLIAADAVDEGSLIAEASLADVHRTHTILRGSKSLASSTWAGNHYRSLYSSDDQVSKFLDQANVTMVFVQTRPPLRPHIVQLHSAIAQNPAWTKVDRTLPGGGIEIYRRTAR